MLASYTALDLGGRIRMATGWAVWAWIAAASVAMGGGIWSMYFIAMLAFQTAMPVAYDFAQTLLSLLLAIAVTAAGFTVVGRKNARPRDTALSGMFMDWASWACIIPACRRCECRPISTTMASSLRCRS